MDITWTGSCPSVPACIGRLAFRTLIKNVGVIEWVDHHKWQQVGHLGLDGGCDVAFLDMKVCWGDKLWSKDGDLPLQAWRQGACSCIAMHRCQFVDPIDIFNDFCFPSQLLFPYHVCFTGTISLPSFHPLANLL